MKALLVLFGIVAGVVLLTIFWWLPLYFLWNWLMPIIFALPEITLWQALGLMFLSSILFKSNTASSK